jgi:hypothetical protein
VHAQAATSPWRAWVAFGVRERDRFAVPRMPNQLADEERVPAHSLTEDMGCGRIAARPQHHCGKA